MLDESGSVIAEDFKKEKNFVAAMANGFGNYGPDGIQMGVISFSTDAQVDIKMNQYRYKQDFVNAVNRIVQFRKYFYKCQVSWDMPFAVQCRAVPCHVMSWP